jgi:serine/threonine protein phosphatase PrpC
MTKLAVRAAGLTDQGKTRPNNEDAVWVDAARGLLIVADGMGGHQAGEVASGLAISSIPGNFEQLAKAGTTGDSTDTRFSAQTNRLGLSVKMANQMIFETAKRHANAVGMGTTCTAALIDDGRLSLAHVGDSRCYLIRHGQMQQLTQDHSLVMEQVRHGLLSIDDEAVQAGQNILTRSLGTELEVKIDLDEHPLFPGDVLLLCSDGLGKELSDDQVLKMAKETSEPSELVKRLIDVANAAGGRDNITVAVARIDKADLGTLIKSFFKSIIR